MEAYRITYTCIIKNKEYQNFSSLILSDEMCENTKTILVDWNNLNDVYSKYGIHLPFNIWNFKKGKLISFWDMSFFDKRTWDIKEWKEKDFSFTFNITTKKFDEYISINRILDYSNSEKAIAYLIERGLKIINKD